ncbi:hypothetical protein C8J57DRAFT_1363635 [Mycena rebaudengoi]|nr:hypothetical protein C8J57DRAFT_1363635 [Mycena rebaudengoi]
MCGHSSFEVCVRENPAHHDTYKIMLYLPAHATPSAPWARNGRLFTYTSTPSPSPHAQPTFQLRSTVHSLISVNWTAMSYAGYAIQRPDAVGLITDYRGDRAGARAGGTTVLKASPGWVKMYYSPLNGQCWELSPMVLSLFLIFNRISCVICTTISRVRLESNPWSQASGISAHIRERTPRAARWLRSFRTRCRHTPRCL